MLQKNFDILAISLSVYVIILIVQQNYFLDLCSAKILALSAKSFFFFFFVELLLSH